MNDLFQVLNNNEGAVVSLSVCAIVGEQALSNIQTYSHIKNVVLVDFEGSYDMTDGLPGYTYVEGISKKGLVINFKERQQLFIPEDAKIEMYGNNKNTTFDIKDKYSSMHIKLQVLSKVKIPN